MSMTGYGPDQIQVPAVHARGGPTRTFAQERSDVRALLTEARHLAMHFAPLEPSSASTHLPYSSRRGDRSVSREGSRELESDQNASAAGSSFLSSFGAEQP